MQSSIASLAPLSIEVKALRIDGRKMTISVFQQLPRLSPFVNPQDDAPVVRTDFTAWGYVRHKIHEQGALWLIAERHGCLHRIALEAYDNTRAQGEARDALRDRILKECEQLFIAA